MFDYALLQNSEYGTKLNWSKPIPSYYLDGSLIVPVRPYADHAKHPKHEDVQI
jgi:hypothetical protein